MDAAQAAQTVQSVFDTLTQLKVSSDSISNGSRLLNALAALLFAWTGIKMMLEFEPVYSAVAKMINTVLLWGFASFLIGTAGGGGLLTELQQGLGSISKAVAPEGTSGDKFVVMGRMVDVATKIWLGPKKAEIPPTRGKDESSGAEGSALSAGESAYASSGGKGGWLRSLFSASVLEDVLFGILSIITRFFVGCFVLIAGLLYFGSVIVAAVMFKIAAVMMPFMVPWILFESTSFIFNGWLKFTITAGLQVIVANIMFGLTLGVVDKVLVLVASAHTDSASEYLAYASALLLTGIMAFLMLQVSSIASGLMSGSARGAWSPSGKLSPGGGISAASGAASKVGAGANSAAGAVSGAAAGGVRSGGSVTDRAKSTIAGAAAGARTGVSGQIRDKLSSWAQQKTGAASTAAKSPVASARGSAGRPNPVQEVRDKLRAAKLMSRGR